MPKDAIFLISNSDQLQRIEHSFYANEDRLQELIEKHPELLAGDQIDPESPPKWLLLERESGIPDGSDCADRWSLDHLLLDQFGVPTFVEVKRSSDPRIRREVIGQMLDYIANAQAYWAMGRMRQMLVTTAGSTEDADLLIAEHLGVAEDREMMSQAVDQFWQTVETNLREGNVRLLFVADELPRELRRLIEFLNAQFTRVEVLGVELRQYVGEGLRALVPRVIGQTEAVREQKGKRQASPSGKPTNRDEFLQACRPDTRRVFTDIMDSLPSDFTIKWAAKSFACCLNLPDGKMIRMLACYHGLNSVGWDNPFIETVSKERRTREMLAPIFAKVPGFQTVGECTARCTLDSGTKVNPADIIKALGECAQALRSA